MLKTISTTAGSTAVNSVTGTANQVTVSPTMGAAVASLPAAIITPGTLKTTTTLWQGGRNAFTNFAGQTPNPTTSATKVMMGLGATYVLTPSFSGRIRAMISGFITNSTLNAGATFNLNYGTGTAPVNGAALTGTAFFGTDYSYTSGLAGGDPLPFALTGEVTGLTPATPYWFDLTLAAAAGSSRIFPCSVIIEEL